MSADVRFTKSECVSRYNRSGPRGAGNTGPGLTQPDRHYRSEGFMKPTLVPSDLPENTDPRLRARITRYVQIDARGCWRWTGGTVVRGGYRQVRNGSRTKTLAHRLTYALCVGPIPEGHQVDHLCRVPDCCNPKHLEAVDPAENLRRRDAARDAREAARVEEVAYWRDRALTAEANLRLVHSMATPESAVAP